MSEVIERVTIGGDMLSIPLIVFRRFGRPVPGLVERIYAMNDGLADLGPYPPVGTVFDMPVTAEGGGEISEPEALEPISLW